MKTRKNGIVIALMFCVCLFFCVGFATITNSLTVEGRVELSPPLPDVYITSITPTESAGVKVNQTNGTVMFSSVEGGGVATFTVNVVNISGGSYVFDRVIDGAETNIEGVYSGTDITYELSGIAKRDEILPNGGTLSFDVTISVPEGITADYYILDFHFVSKYGIPDEDYFPEDMPEKEVSIVERLSNILNNLYKSNNMEGLDSRTYLLEKAIQDRWSEYADPYVGTMSEKYSGPLEVLFGDIYLDESVSFILKNQDINWDGYNEITLYSTSDPLKNTSQNLVGVVCVYATVFTPVIDEQKNVIGYNMVCEAMRGFCYEVNYGSGNTNPSFSTDEWKNDVGYMVEWIDGVGAVLSDIPEDVPAYNQYWNPFDKNDYYSYNAYYVPTTNYWWYNTAPYGNNLRTCLEGKIPTLPW